MTLGIDEPDARGRTGLDQVGRDLAGNPRVVVKDVEVIGLGWHVLRATTFDYQRKDGEWETQRRETYDRGNGATILLYNSERRTVLLTRQFRYPVYVNGHPDGMLVETAAGLLDDDDPITAIRREAEEETGHTVGEITPVFDLYMSPGSVTEKIHFFAAEYNPTTRSSDGGGLADEGEEIEILETDFDAALAAIGTTIVDAKTVLLLQWAARSGPFAAPALGAASPGVPLVTTEAASPDAAVGAAAAAAAATSTSPATADPAHASLGRLRRIAVIAVIASVTIAAIIGIGTLLLGDFNDTAGRVLGTTLAIGAFSILSLCHLAVAGRPVRVVGYVGIAVSVIAVVLLIVAIWWDYDSGSSEVLSTVWRWIGVTSIVAVSLAQTNLLLLLSARTQQVIRIMLIVTLAAIAVVAIMVILPILSDGDIPGYPADGYWRAFGAIAIIDALGTIVLPVIGRVLRPARVR